MSLVVSIPTVRAGNPAQYRIVVSLGQDVSYEIEHRYSDFLKLAEDAKAELGEPVPVPPPSKPSAWRSWRGNSSQSEQLLESRRVELEAMLRALVRAPEFSDSLALSRFLDLSRRKQPRADSDPAAARDWLQTTTEISRLVSEAKSSLSQSAAQRSQVSRPKCVRAKALIGQLQRGLDNQKTAIGSGERQRRQQQLDHWLYQLQTIEQGLVQTSDVPGGTGYDSGDSVPRGSAAGMANEAMALFGHNRASGPREGRALGSVLPETEKTRELNNTGLLSVQKDVVAAQDSQIEDLRVAINRQKELGLAINDELAKHTQLLDELDDDVHRVNARLNEAKRKTARLH